MDQLRAALQAADGAAAALESEGAAHRAAAEQLEAGLQAELTAKKEELQRLREELCGFREREVSARGEVADLASAFPLPGAIVQRIRDVLFSVDDLGALVLHALEVVLSPTFVHWFGEQINLLNLELRKAAQDDYKEAEKRACQALLLPALRPAFRRVLLQARSPALVTLRVQGLTAAAGGAAGSVAGQALQVFRGPLLALGGLRPFGRQARSCKARNGAVPACAEVRYNQRSPFAFAELTPRGARYARSLYEVVTLLDKAVLPPSLAVDWDVVGTTAFYSAASYDRMDGRRVQHGALCNFAACCVSLMRGSKQLPGPNRGCAYVASPVR
jgi:hypothetical protein